ncbi:MAG: hypothetical protein HRT58_15675 [Crocinitomicaceae bacterium]|nr:hypothetical protein [Flavobacteriales bacterium]NQZ37108.1 hypothetical protein [Crocinitomicaceae bacterium]
MYRRINNKFKELPPRFFLIAGVVLVAVLITVPILIKYIDGRIDKSPDYRMVLDQYSNCTSCKTFTGEKPKFERISYSSEGNSFRKYSYVINVTGNNQNATINAELRKSEETYEIVHWTYANQDTSILID